MSRVLIIYATHYGQTRLIAERIAQRLRLRDHSVDVVDVRAPSLPVPERYDVVVIGSRVELGRHAIGVIEYVLEHHETLCAMPTAFFSVSMAAARADAGSDPSGYMMATFAELDWYPAQSVAFAGGLPYRRYGRILRWVMKRIAHGAGHTTDATRDHEFTNWEAVTTFADKIAYIAGGSPSRMASQPKPLATTN